MHSCNNNNGKMRLHKVNKLREVATTTTTTTTKTKTRTSSPTSATKTTTKLNTRAAPPTTAATRTKIITNNMTLTSRRKLFHDWFNLLALIWLIISDICLNAYCLKDLKIFVPEAVIMGNAATLSCQYDLENAALYSVRWYFANEEFYRFVQKESPPTLVFHVSGINVDLTNSDARSVTLKGVTRELTGSYQCEVSEDAPLFHTDIRSAHMQVIELPKDEPTMQVDKKILTAGDHLKAFCSVGPSYPPANITWHINSLKILKEPGQRITYDTQGSATHSSLELSAQSRVLRNFFSSARKYQPTMLLACEVSILHVFHKNVQQRLMLSIAPPTTISPNLLGLEGSKRHNGGDPDNSALTGNHGTRNVTLHPVIAVLLGVIFAAAVAGAGATAAAGLVLLFSTTLATVPLPRISATQPTTTTATTNVITLQSTAAAALQRLRAHSRQV